MVNKKTIILSGIVILIVLVLILIKINQPQIPKEKTYFTAEPETWIEENVLTDDEKDVRINVMKASGGKSSFSGNKLDYFYAGKENVFFSHGSYKGENFDTVYLEPEFYEINQNLTRQELLDLTKEYTLMEITPYLNPEDKIMQGFILAKKDENGFLFYIFVDEDWKKSLEFTNIVYGSNFNDINTLKTKKFTFDEIKEGIYMDKIEDYDKWYEEDPVKGGIIVGEVKLNELKDNTKNITYIIIR